MRVKLPLAKRYPFETPLSIRVNDLNYGNHLSNDRFLTLAHEARMRFFALLGYKETDFAGEDLIMSDAAQMFLAEGFWGQEIVIQIAVGDIYSLGFDLHYRFLRPEDQQEMARIKTALLCYDYQAQKLVRLPKEAAEKLEKYQGL